MEVKAPLKPDPFLILVAKIFGVKLPEFINARGSGVILQNNGRVVTANHVVDIPERISVIAVSTQGERVGCTVLAQDKDRDLALLACDAFSHVSGVKHLAPMTIRVGTRAVAAGFPGGGPWIMSDGIIANHLDGKGKLLLSIPAGKGMSGGGVFTYGGELVGIIQAGYREPPFTLITTNHLQLHRFLYANRRFLDGYDQR